MPLMSSTCPFKFVSTVCRSAPSFSSLFSPRAPALSLLTFSWVRGLKFPSSIPRSPVNVTFFRNGVWAGGLKLILSAKLGFAEIACVPSATFARCADFAGRLWVRQSHVEPESRTRLNVVELQFVHEKSQWLLIGATELQNRICRGELYD